MTPGDLRRMREAGWTYRQIEAITGVHWSTVRSRCRSLGIKSQTKVIHSRKRPFKYPVPKELLELMYWECRLSTIDIGYELDISHHTVRGMMYRYGIPMRDRGQARKLFLEHNPEHNFPPRPSHAEAVEAGRMSGAARRRKRNEQATSTT